MKTLINKNNPQIRITAPEIERRKAMFYQDEHYCLIIKGLPWLDADDWTLVEEEPVVLEKILELVEKPLELFTAGNLDRLKGYTKHDMQDAFILGFKAGVDNIKEQFSKIVEEEPVDIMKEIDRYFGNYKDPVTKEKYRKSICWLNHRQAIKFAKHFYELGRKGGSK